MSRPTDIQAGMVFRGKDGSTRYVLKVHKPGSGYSVTWDSVPPDWSTFNWHDYYERQRKGKAGQCAMFLFREWAAYKVPQERKE